MVAPRRLRRRHGTHRFVRHRVQFPRAVRSYRIDPGYAVETNRHGTGAQPVACYDAPLSSRYRGRDEQRSAPWSTRRRSDSAGFSTGSCRAPCSSRSRAYVALPLRPLRGISLSYAAQHGIQPCPGAGSRRAVRAPDCGLSGVRIVTSGDNSATEWSSVEARVELAALAVRTTRARPTFDFSEAKLHAGDPYAVGIVPDPADCARFAAGRNRASASSSSTSVELDGDHRSADRTARSTDRPSSASRRSPRCFGRTDPPIVEADVSIGDRQAPGLTGRISSRRRRDGYSNASEIDCARRRSGWPSRRSLRSLDGSWRGRHRRRSGPLRLVYSPVNAAFSATTRGAGGRSREPWRWGMRMSVDLRIPCRIGTANAFIDVLRGVRSRCSASDGEAAPERESPT